MWTDKRQLMMSSSHGAATRQRSSSVVSLHTAVSSNMNRQMCHNSSNALTSPVFAPCVTGNRKFREDRPVSYASVLVAPAWQRCTSQSACFGQLRRTGPCRTPPRESGPCQWASSQLACGGRKRCSNVTTAPLFGTSHWRWEYSMRSIVMFYMGRHYTFNRICCHNDSDTSAGSCLFERTVMSTPPSTGIMPDQGRTCSLSEVITNYKLGLLKYSYTHTWQKLTQTLQFGVQAPAAPWLGTWAHGC